MAAADTIMGEKGGEREDAGMRIMLQASAALEVARIQRLARMESPGGVTGQNGQQLGTMVRNSDSFDTESFDGGDSFTTCTFQSGDS